MSQSDFPPKEVREIVNEVAALLKDRKETVSVAETASLAEPLDIPMLMYHVRPQAASSPPHSSR